MPMTGADKMRMSMKTGMKPGMKGYKKGGMVKSAGSALKKKGTAGAAVKGFKKGGMTRGK